MCVYIYTHTVTVVTASHMRMLHTYHAYIRRNRLYMCVSHTHVVVDHDWFLSRPTPAPFVWTVVTYKSRRCLA